MRRSPGDRPVRLTPLRYFTDREETEEGFGPVVLYAELEDPHPAVDFHTEGVPHVVYHSPSGLEYGYGGSGPADLALSLLAHWFGVNALTLSRKMRLMGAQSNRAELTDDERRAVNLHQDFKFRFVAPADRSGELVIGRAEILDFLREQRR
jgi:hypothetical protein